MSKTLYIGGEWISAEKKQTRRIINPFNQEEIATVCEGDRDDAVKAIAAARKAFDEGEWPVLSGLERGQFVLKIAELIRRDLNELAELESLDTGKTIEESKADMDDIANVFQYYAGLADKDGGEVISSPIPDSVSKIVREPIGVCGQITPWNYPLLQASWKIAPALAAGNTIVLKPSEITPLTTIKVFQLIEEAGIPKGAANLVLGPGASVGDELARNLDVDLVSFTGGIETGKKIMQAASGNVKKIALELGGKNPNIVFQDADLETAADQALNAVFFHAGQVCSAGSRLLVDEAIHDEFLAELIKRTKRIKLGNGFHEDTESGPLISAEHRAKVEKYVEIGIEEGAKLETGGKRPDDPALQNGFFYEPTIFSNCKSDMRIVQEEIFGPVLTVESFSSEEEVIRLANDTIYGLAGAVWSKDIEKCERVAQKLRMGTVWINDFHPYFAQAPWGGYKQSGFGRELGKIGLEEYTEVKHIYRNTKPAAVNWFKA
ncbi:MULTISPECIES: betaine-aldehyde dehydrogenase [Bacillus]|uniref:Betaine-aldehyde dehydrogenase n=4 Tax=Bacillus amyloliquefaciens TaxID=1390 RepID=A0A9P1JJ89_BACAS|nr:betaine-aldehyde dehydrogenase [Bacillus amyloliquefaciens]AIW34867.1 betaine-aldehyde dehydrogenase [Bacillus subtilis]AEB25187.1 betaine aldehyde dehydrogenase [Bacillus amyloliquefaciens TA208]AEB64700.1 glycine betaine aldehyde dehydrogenase, NAD+-dependent [Bacillus amyloliquefaciens LL3]AEK90224.1 glycine betaine aldehyde dehydrogenase [Bacillus amyloliquefaciens XH7]ARW40197.1 Betaine-aldehyde dehydrogenase [Bacillus amyloliquefaciens]